MRYRVDLADRRNVILCESLLGAHEYVTGHGDEGDYIIFSPAKRLTEDEAAALPQSCAVFGGKQTSSVLNIMQGSGISYTNILADEIYAVKNAVLTAEGALHLLISATERSIFENKILILGLGRVGKACAALFSKLNLDFAVTTYDKDELAQSTYFTKKCYFEDEFGGDLDKFDVVINTIPSEILDGENLGKIARGTTLIELASAPCVSDEAIVKYGIKYKKAGGLPSVYSAESAAKQMLESIMRFTKKKVR